MTRFLAAIAAVITIPVLAGQAAAAEPATTSTIFGEDDRVPLENASAAPYNAVARLEITYRDGTVNYGTGFFYRQNMLATAAHCLYKGGEVEQVVIYPAVTGGNAPFEPIVADAQNSTFFYPDEWAGGEGWRYDYGAIRLDAPADAGIRPLRLARPASGELRGKTLSLLGYDYLSDTLYRSDGALSLIRSDDLLYRIDTMPGMSGGPLVDGQNRVVGIANYGAEEGGLRYNSAARMNEKVYRFLINAAKG